MTVVQPNSIAGINSITALDDKITFHKSDGSSAGLTFNNTNFSNTTGVSTFANINITGAASTISANGNATFSGIITAANFVGGGANITALSGSNIASGTVAAARVATLNQDTTGNAATATALETARAIGGVNFDGSAAINLPGVNASGSQDTSGTAAGLSGSPTITVAKVNVGTAATIYANGNVTAGIVTSQNVTISSGDIDLKNSGSVSNIKFYCESSNAHYTALQSAAHSAYSGNVTLTLPAITDTLIGKTTTDTLTNKTLSAPSVTGNLSVDSDIVHTGDTDTKIAFTSNQIDFQANSASRLYINQYAAFVQAGFPLAFLASSGDSPNIKSGGTNNQDILFTAGTSNPTRLQITSAGYVGINSTAPSSSLDVRGGLSVGHGIIQERALFESGGSPSGTFNINVLTNGMVYRTSANMAGTFTINLRGDGSTTFNSLMNVGATAVYTFYAGSNNTSYVLQNFQIDGSNITEKWNGGSAPSAATGSGTDVYTFNIMKTADATFTVFATFSNFA